MNLLKYIIVDGRRLRNTFKKQAIMKLKVKLFVCGDHNEQYYKTPLGFLLILLIETFWVVIIHRVFLAVALKCCYSIRLC